MLDMSIKNNLSLYYLIICLRFTLFTLLWFSSSSTINDNGESWIIETGLEKGKVVAFRNFNLCKSYVKDIFLKKVKSIQNHPLSHQTIHQAMIKRAMLDQHKESTKKNHLLKCQRMIDVIIERRDKLPQNTAITR